MARELVDIKELLLHCQEIFTIRAEEKGIFLKTEIEPLVPVAGDIDRLEQAFSNLLDNASKNSPANGEVHNLAPLDCSFNNHGRLLPVSGFFSVSYSYSVCAILMGIFTSLVRPSR